jgi:hypothetical protein
MFEGLGEKGRSRRESGLSAANGTFRSPWLAGGDTAWRRRLAPITATLLGAAILCLWAAPARAAMGSWDRAWGKDVNGGGVFGICTVASSCQAGTAGGLGGEMNNPAGLATDSSGNVYVADLGNHRILKFDSSGNFLRAWGKDVDSTTAGTGFEICTAASGDTCQAGTAGGLGGEMSFPVGVATDGAGNVYVSEGGNHRIQKFDSSGTWQRAWGKNVNGGGVFGVCTVASSCLAGTTGGLGGEMNNPGGLATDSSGNVYVADRMNNRIQKFDSSGNFLRAWGKDVDMTTAGTGFEICTAASGDTCKAGTTGGLGGEMNVPFAVATDASGSVYIADLNNHRIQKFDSSGNFLAAWGKNVNGGGVFGVCSVASSCLAGTTGGLGGEMSSPGWVATDAVGSVYVSDIINHRVQKFDSSGTWQRAWGKNVNGGGVFGVCTVASSCLAGSVGGLGGEMNLPVGIATDAGGNVYVAEQNNNRIQRFRDPVLNVSVAGAGTGTVAGTGISCPGTCSQSYLSGTTVGLTATPGAGSAFAGWGGACSGTGTCLVTMSPDQSAVATFTLNPGPTGLRAAALKKCKKKFPHNKAKRRKCRKKANLLPV